MKEGTQYFTKKGFQFGYSLTVLMVILSVGALGREVDLSY